MDGQPLPGSGGPDRDPRHARGDAAARHDAGEGHDGPLDAMLRARDGDPVAIVRRALAAGDAMLAYQPVIDVLTGEAAFHEGLIRLTDAGGRIVPAARFMDAVEAHPLGREVDRIALALGLRALRLHPGLRLSVNMSARSIGYAPWRDTLERGLAADPALGDRLILEITERSAMTVPELAVAFMAEMQGRGIAFALDDFGAGATSFRYLRDFAFDILKIDGAFVRDCDRDADSQCILGAMVAIGQQFEMFTVAEAVETRGEAAFLAGIGLDCLQGYHYGAPLVRPAWLDPRADPGAAPPGWG
jgi:EAL domain-containing protein (putative c-di-GMP-specific phosphodiesterase class I)